MSLTESILNSVKVQLGVDESVEVFDPAITMNINSAIAVLTQLGIGPKEGFMIEGPETTYEDFIGEHTTQMSMVKTYLYAKTQLLFDNASLSGGMLEALKSQIAEIEWRLQHQAEFVDANEEEEVEYSK